MNKVLEYMATGLPIVSFDLREARVSAGEAARYAPCNDTEQFAAEITALLEDQIERRRRGRIGAQRLEGTLNWEHSKTQLIAAYATALGQSPAPADQPVAEPQARAAA
jgi:glycosyltransferase involved in cell wall biosynthesis